MKYTPAELRAMSDRLLKAKKNGDGRYSTFVFTLSIRTGVTPSEIEKVIVNTSRRNNAR